jgi:putative hydrolase of the HAD superfamily
MLLNVKKYFDKTIFSCEVGYVKPDPKLFETALRAMGNPQHTVFIGDGGHEELQGAQKAGMQTIKAEWIKNRREEELYAHSNFRLQSTEQVLETVNSIDFTKQQITETETQQQESIQQQI